MNIKVLNPSSQARLTDFNTYATVFDNSNQGKNKMMCEKID